MIEMGARRGGKRQRLADLLAESSKTTTRLFDEAVRKPVNGGLKIEPYQQHVVDYLQGMKIDFTAIDEGSHVADAFLYGQAANRLHRPVDEQLSKFNNADLVMEMLKRGFAVMKCPNGQVPEILRGQD